MRAAQDREWRIKTIEDARAYSLAGLIAYAVNDPKKMPKFEKVFPSGRAKRAQTPDEMLMLMREWAEVSAAIEGHDG